MENVIAFLCTSDCCLATNSRQTITFKWTVLSTSKFSAFGERTKYQRAAQIVFRRGAWTTYTHSSPALHVSRNNGVNSVPGRECSHGEAAALMWIYPSIHKQCLNNFRPTLLLAQGQETHSRCGFMVFHRGPEHGIRSYNCKKRSDFPTVTLTRPLLTDWPGYNGSGREGGGWVQTKTKMDHDCSRLVWQHALKKSVPCIGTQQSDLALPVAWCPRNDPPLRIACTAPTAWFQSCKSSGWHLETEISLWALPPHTNLLSCPIPWKESWLDWVQTAWKLQTNLLTMQSPISSRLCLGTFSGRRGEAAEPLINSVQFSSKRGQKDVWLFGD